MNATEEKGLALLAFLKASATLRRKRVSAYGTGDKLIWLGDVPRDRAECRSPFLTDNLAELGDVWLEVRKRRMPTRSPLPEFLTDWVRPDELEHADKQPELRSEITVLVDQSVLGVDTAPGVTRVVVDKRPEVRRLSEHPEVEDRWLDYLVNKWEPWAKDMLRWQDAQSVYEELDFIRRRIEESEERYELSLGVGLLQWRDPTGTPVKRHVLTAPAEINLDAARGVLTVVPAASFDRFRVELDMLELQHQPRLNGTTIEEKLDELDVQAWDTDRVAPILREFANLLRPDSVVDDLALRPAERVEETPRLSYAPALVLRERRPTGYEDLVRKFLELAGGADADDTLPWRRLLLEGEPLGGPSGGGEPEPDANQFRENPARYLFPLPANDEQRQIVHSLRLEPCVLVKGPPGTGKSHTIANLICHLLASGQRILVTAHAPKALAVLRGLLPDDIRDLTVTTLGSSREDQRLLEESVRGILRRKNEWRGAGPAKQANDQTEKRLQQVEGELATIERHLRECREAETHPHMLPGGYDGTAARIAQRLHEEREEFDWIPDVGSAETQFPIPVEDVAFVADVHGGLTPETLEELSQHVGDFQLPEPEEFARRISDLKDAEDAAGEAMNAAAKEKTHALRGSSHEDLDRFQAGLAEIEQAAVRATRVLGGLVDTILADLLVANNEPWIRLESEASSLSDSASKLLKRLGPAHVEVPADVHRDQLRTDAQRRRAHFEHGGRRGFAVFSPRVVKETRYVEERCLVDGQRPKELGRLSRVADYCQLGQAMREFERLWPSPLEPSQDLSRAAGSVPSSVEKEKRRNLLLSKQGPHNEDGGLRREGSYHDQG